jgi:phosphoenolpyruvate synthase/pyruvate phosphate dikinase
LFRLPSIPKAVILGLTSIFFASNVVLAYSYETNLASRQAGFWKSRRENIQVAALPTSIPAPNAISSLPPVPKTLPQSLTQSITKKRLQKWTGPPVNSHLKRVLTVLSNPLGTIRDVQVPKNMNVDKRGPIVVHVQDVHMNTEAQKNISELLGRLLEEDLVQLVAVEGAFAPIDLSEIRGMEDKDAVRRVSEYLLRQHKISGPMHVAYTHPQDIPPFMGIDDKGHYDANVAAVKNGYREKEKTQKDIEAATRENENAKSHTLNKDLLAFDQKVVGHRQDRIDMGEYIQHLVSDEDDVPLSISPFLEALKIERSLNFNQVDHERAILLKKLLSGLSPDKTKELMDLSVAFRTGQLNHADFYSYLERLCQKQGINLNWLPAMRDYLHYVMLSDSIDLESITQEVKALEKVKYNALIQTPAERVLIEESHFLHLLEKLVNFSLTQREWEEYKAMLRGFDATMPRKDRHYVASKLLSLMASFEGFYNEAEIRDQKMATNILSAIDTNQPRVSVVVTGGFHAKGIQKKLNKESVTTINWVPKLTTVTTDKGTNCLSVFAQEKSPLDQLLAGEVLFLASPPTISPPSFVSMVKLARQRTQHAVTRMGRIVLHMTSNPKTGEIMRVWIVPAAAGAGLWALFSGWIPFGWVGTLFMGPGLAMVVARNGEDDEKNKEAGDSSLTPFHRERELVYINAPLDQSGNPHWRHQEHFRIHPAAGRELQDIEGLGVAENMPESKLQELFSTESMDDKSRSMANVLVRQIGTLKDFRRHHNGAFSTLLTTQDWSHPGIKQDFISEMEGMLDAFVQLPMDRDMREVARQKWSELFTQYKNAVYEGEATLAQFMTAMQGNWVMAEQRNHHNITTFNKLINWVHERVNELILSLTGDQKILIDLIHYSDPTRFSPAVQLIKNNYPALIGKFNGQLILHENMVWISRKMSVHSAQLYGEFNPPEMGGKVEVIHLEGSAKVENHLRVKVLGGVLEQLGFDVTYPNPSEYHSEKMVLRAVYGKDQNAHTAEDLMVRFSIALHLTSDHSTLALAEFLGNLRQGYEAPENLQSLGYDLGKDPLQSPPTIMKALSVSKDILSRLVAGWVRKFYVMGGTLQSENMDVVDGDDNRGRDEPEEVFLVSDPATGTPFTTYDGKSAKVWNGRDKYNDTQWARIIQRNPQIHHALNKTLNRLGLPPMPPYREDEFGQHFIDRNFNMVIDHAISDGRLVRSIHGWEPNAHRTEKPDALVFIEQWEDPKNKHAMVQLGNMITNMPLDYKRVGVIGSTRLLKSGISLLSGQITVYLNSHENNTSHPQAALVLFNGRPITPQEFSEVMVKNDIPIGHIDKIVDSHTIQEVEDAMTSNIKETIYTGTPIQGQSFIEGFSSGQATFKSGPQAMLDGKIVIHESLREENITDLGRSNGVINVRGNPLEHLSLRARLYNKPRVVTSNGEIKTDENGSYLQINADVSETQFKPMDHEKYKVKIFPIENQQASLINIREGDMLTMDGRTGAIYWYGPANKTSNVKKAFRLLRNLVAGKRGNFQASLENLYDFIRELEGQGDVDTIKFLLRVLLLGERITSASDQAFSLTNVIDTSQLELTRLLERLVQENHGGLPSEQAHEIQKYIESVLLESRLSLDKKLNQTLQEINIAINFDHLYYLADSMIKEIDAFESLLQLLPQNIQREHGINFEDDFINKLAASVIRRRYALAQFLIDVLMVIYSMLQHGKLDRKFFSFIVRIKERLNEFEKYGWARAELIDDIARQLDQWIEVNKDLRREQIQKMATQLTVDLADVDRDFGEIEGWGEKNLQNDFGSYASLVGNKAANLGWLMRFLEWLELLERFKSEDSSHPEIPTSVPKGIVSTSNAWEQFLNTPLPSGNTLKKEIQSILDNKSWPSEMHGDAIHQLMMSTEVPLEIKQNVNQSMMKGFKATRSSTLIEDTPQGSAAGLFESPLGARDIYEVIFSIRSTWASLFSRAALIFREENAEIPSARADEKQGVIIQSLVNSDVSGVMTSADLTSRHRGVIEINSAWGIGEALVQGNVPADRFHVDKISNQIKYFPAPKESKIDKLILGEDGHLHMVPMSGFERDNISLKEDQIRVLAELAKKMERWFGFVVDVEFAFHKDKLYLLQIRPVPGFRVDSRRRAEINKILKLNPKQEQKFGPENPPASSKGYGHIQKKTFLLLIMLGGLGALLGREFFSTMGTFIAMGGDEPRHGLFSHPERLFPRKEKSGLEGRRL